MRSAVDRRHTLGAIAGAALAGTLCPDPLEAAQAAKPWFTISLAQWSLHQALFAKKIDNLDFPMIARKEFADAFETISASTSYGGNPMACAAALASIQVIEEEGLLQNAQRLEVFFQRSAQRLQRAYFIVDDEDGGKPGGTGYAHAGRLSS